MTIEEKLTRLVVNCETGEEIIEELTPEEVEQFHKDRAEAAARREQEMAEIKAREEAKASALAKLAALGLTEDEAKAIAG